MANTALLQAVTQMLMQGRPQSPMAPIPSGGFTPPGGLGSLMPILEAPPTVAPVAPMPARDDALIALLSGTPPVAPTPQPDSLIQTISRALMGFGAGVEGRGPQFLAGLQEQRERPQRELRAATEQFEDRRRGAIQFEEGLRQRERGETQRRADIQSDRDFDMRTLETRDRMQEARDLRQQAAAIEKEERQKQKEKEEADRKERLAQEKQRNDIAADLMKSPNFAPQAIANAIADAQVFGKPLSPAAEKWRSVQVRKAEAQLAKLNASGTGSGKGDETAKLVAQFESLKDQLYPARARGDKTQANNIMRRIEAVGVQLQAKGYEVGYGADPYQKPPQGQQQPTAQAAAPQNKDPLGIR